MRFKIMENKIEKRNYVVYKHTSPSNKVYIGITGQIPPEKRWANGHGYTQNEYFNSEIIQYGWDKFSHEILFYGLTKNEAQKKESELIIQYKSTDKNFGYNIKSELSLSVKNLSILLFCLKARTYCSSRISSSFG